MQHVHCSATTADEQVTDHGEVTCEQALTIVSQFPWAAQNARSQQTGVGPSVSFGFQGGERTYLNLVGLEGESLMVMMEVVLKPGFLGILSRKAASLEKDLSSAHEAMVYVQKLYELDRDALYEWVRSRAHP